MILRFQKSPCDPFPCQLFLWPQFLLLLAFPQPPQAPPCPREVLAVASAINSLLCYGYLSHSFQDFYLDVILSGRSTSIMHLFSNPALKISLSFSPYHLPLPTHNLLYCQFSSTRGFKKESISALLSTALALKSRTFLGTSQVLNKYFMQELISETQTYPSVEDGVAKFQHFSSN